MNGIWKCIIFLFGTGFMAHAEPYQLEGTPFQPPTNVEVVWTATIPNLPKGLWVYKILPQTFSAAVIANLLKLSDLESNNLLTEPTDELIPDKNFIRFAILNQKGRHLHSLDIAPNLGWICYEDNSGDYHDKIEPAPSEVKVKNLAYDILFQAGIDNSQVLHASTNFPIGSMKVGNGPEVISSRSIVLVRKIGGINERGFCFRAEFGTHNREPKLLEFDLNWRNLLPYEARRVATKYEMIEFIKNGKTTTSFSEVDINTLKHSKKLTVTTFFPLYYNKPGFYQVDYEYPYVVMDIVADISDKQTVSFSLNCPLLSTNEFKSLLEK
jgi:hypothetical protein